MTLRSTAVLLAAAGALAYAVAKVDLALRGELGMPGFTAPPESYRAYDPFTGQLSNAVLGLVLVAVIAGLLRPPNRLLLRRGLLGANVLGALAIGAGVIGFLLRATGVAPQLGTPAEGVATWVTLLVGALWICAWAVAIVTTARSRRPAHEAPAP